MANVGVQLGRTYERQRSEEELRRAHSILEQKVDQRTAELEAVGEALRAARDQALEASRAKSAFLANMSHELRTPLNAILGYTEMVEEELRETGQEQLAEDLGKVKTSAEHLLALISDILDLARIEAGRVELSLEELEPTEIVREAAELVRFVAAKNHNQVETRCEQPVGKVRLDRMRVRQIFFNLLSNAAKFTENGLITLSCHRTRDAAGEWTEVRVQDTGIGLAPERAAELFEKFHQIDTSSTRRHEGAGLGLAISRHLARALGGDISVESILGQGSTFTLRLPNGLSGSDA